LQKLPLPFAAGDAVLARGEQWVVEETTAFEDCVLVHVAREARRARFLYPFDRPLVVNTDRRLCIVKRRRWMKNLQSYLADLRRYDQLRCARAASIEIFPFQLEPALALIRGRAARVLLADEVGLGKTIQAGLILAELQQRGWCERALVLCPAGLCQQWADELARRFHIGAQVFDAPALRHFAAALPFGVNPWMVEPVTITSIDFIKQPEVLRTVTSVIWDIVIIDEAHQAATAPRRAAAANLLAQRSRHVVLVTATPHDGDDAAYRSLCAIGEIGCDDPLLTFRRTREIVGLKQTRKVHLLPVQPGPLEIEMHRLLAAYAKRLWHIRAGDAAGSAQLVAMVLSKRAMSSASSLAISIERRLACFAGHDAAAIQSGLPFDRIDEDEGVADATPLLAVPAFDCIEEEDALRAILDVSERARQDESKVRALIRLLRRACEPAVVFTEYRDTLAMLDEALRPLRRVALLHGGLSAVERRAAVHAFNTGMADLLLATDAGSEGLNLQSRCRLVVNLELPWNPIRLEQRIGRVDRLGQSRPVHAIHLFANGTAEATVLANLHRRVRQIRASEIEMAACVIGGTDTAPRTSAAEDAPHPVTILADVKADAETEASRLCQLKGSRVLSQRDERHVLACVRRSRNRQFTQSPAVIWFYRARIVNGCGRLVEELLLPVQLPLARSEVADACALGRRRRDIRAMADKTDERFREAVTSVVRQHVEERAGQIAAASREWVARALARERQLALAVGADSALFQAGLFDARSLKQREDLRAQQQRFVEETASRIGHLEWDAVMSIAQAPELVLLLLQC
jgi:superfamily II DNA or RNA helicase